MAEFELRLKRGLKSNLPTSAVYGEPLLAKTSDGRYELYVGTGSNNPLHKFGTDVHVGSTAPSNTSTYTLWFDTTTEDWKRYNSTSATWEYAGSSTKVGHTILNETNKGDKKGIVYNAQNDEFEYVPLVGFVSESLPNTRSTVQRTFTVPEYQMGNHSLEVMVEGIEMSPSTDYTEIDNTTIEFNFDINIEDHVKFRGIQMYTTGIVSDINDSSVLTTSTWSSNKVNAELGDIRNNLGKVGTKFVDETNLTDGSVIRYDSLSGKFSHTNSIDLGTF